MKRIKSAIDFALIHGHRTNLDAMITELNGKGIATVLRQNSDGLIYGITLVDHQTKAVFNGGDLGKQYSIKGIMERCGDQKIVVAEGRKINAIVDKNTPSTNIINSFSVLNQQYSPGSKDAKNGVLSELFKVEYGTGHFPPDLKKRRKRKKRNQSNNL